MRRRMKGQGEAVLRAAGAATLLAALVVGVPYLLVSAVGNPLPGSMPTVDEVRILLTQNGQGFTNFLIGTLAVLVWAIWVQLMIALVVEVVATIGERETRRLRIAPGLQPFVARLVAAVTLATTLAAGPLLAPAVGALSFADAVQANPVAMTVADVFDRAPPEVEVVAPGLDAAKQPTMIVVDHTELWDLAEAAYGDGVSWKVIATANAGSSDAYGVVITGETETVAPGTELRLPGAVNSSAIGRFGAMQVVQSGDSMWSLAESEVERRLGRPGTEVEVAEYWSDVVAANVDVSSGDADLIYPGESLSLPGAPEAVAPILEATAPAVIEPVTTEPASPEPASPDLGTDSQAAWTSVVDGPADNRNSTVDSDRRGELVAEEADTQETSTDQTDSTEQASSPTIPESAPLRSAPSSSIPIPALGMTALGAAMLGAGVVSAVRRRRDLQRRTRPVGTRARPASAEAAAFEAAIAHMADDVNESTLGLGWRVLPAAAVPALLASVAEPGDGPAHRLAAPIVENWEDQPAEPEAAVSAPAADSPTPVAPVPAASITTIVGTDVANGEAVLVDLAAANTFALRGSDADVRSVAKSIVLDLAVSDRCDSVYVIAVGIAPEIADLERVHHVQDFANAAALASRMGWLSPDATTPVVVVAGARAADEEALSTLQAAGALIVAPELETEQRIEIDGKQATMEPEGQLIELVALDDQQYRSVAELIDTTSGAALEVVDETVGVHEVLDVMKVRECSVEAGEREVKVLGPVDVAGVESFSSLKAVDVVAYLAFHRHGVDADQIKTWVWPTFEPPTDKAFANVMSRARTGLGADANGAPYLSRAGADKTYRLDEAVTTDFDRFRALVELAERADDAAATLDLYRQALELIRGVPFTGGSASSFSWADNHVRAQVEYTIDEAVHRCADLALEAEDLATARWAALKGLELVPGCEQCFRRRFLIARAGNNRSELRRAMADLEASAMIDLGEPEAVDMISGDLLDLYHELDRSLVGRAS